MVYVIRNGLQWKDVRKGVLILFKPLHNSKRVAPALNSAPKRSARGERRHGARASMGA